MEAHQTKQEKVKKAEKDSTEHMESNAEMANSGMVSQKKIIMKFL